MCGIAGVVGAGPVDRGSVERMADVLRHRGPDDFGTYFADGVGLAHRRLAIIDLSDAGHQPMFNETGDLVIVFNGEIFNYAELLPTLESCGHVFRSRSDTEVILHAYEEWGDECVTRFNGMWAFAIWDGRRRELFCSRDRFGVKPLYYSLVEDGLVFGSEIKAVLAAGVDARINEASLAHALLDLIIDDSDETFFAGVRQLPPAHSMRFADGRVRVTRHWDYDEDRALATYDFSDPEQGVRELLQDAVRLRILASDVQVGSCLSGGIDSSSIVSLASGLFDARMATFSVKYTEPGFAESRFAELVARTFGCDAHSVQPGPDEFLETMARMAWFQDEPSTALGLYSQWRVMELAHPHVKVLLDGQGGDELFAGYRNYLDIHLQSLLRSGLTRPGDLKTLSAELPAAARTWELSPVRAWARLFAGRGARDLYRRVTHTGTMRDLTDDFRDAALRVRRERDESRKLADPVNDRLYRDLTRDLIPSLLHYEDRNSMAFSMEARTPFLDYRLVEYALTVPGALKLRGGHTKALLRQAMRGITPDAVLDRDDKMGYSTPASVWLRGPLLEPVREILLSEQTRSRGILDAGTVERKLLDHAEGRADLSWHICRWLSLEFWFRTFVDARDSSLGPVSAEPSRAGFERAS